MKFISIKKMGEPTQIINMFHIAKIKEIDEGTGIEFVFAADLVYSNVINQCKKEYIKKLIKDIEYFLGENDSHMYIKVGEPENE